MSFDPKKLYYKIGEVCETVGVEPYVLRYWETEFPSLQPRKSKGRQRLYRPSDIELLLKIKELLYEDGFTIAGARRKLAASRPGGAVARKGARAAEKPAAAAPPPEPSENISRVRRELESILTLLDRE